MVTGIDIVKEGIRVAAGAELSISQEDVGSAGMRSSAGSTPRTRRRTSLPPPARSATTASPPGPACASTPGSARAGDLAHVRPDGGQADRLGRRPGAGHPADAAALGEYEITQLKTLIPFHQAILATGQWANAETCRDLIEDRVAQAARFPQAEPPGRPKTTQIRWSRATQSRCQASGLTSRSSAPRRRAAAPLPANAAGAAQPAPRRSDRAARAAEGVATRFPHRCRAPCSG